MTNQIPPVFSNGYCFKDFGLDAKTGEYFACFYDPETGRDVLMLEEKIRLMISDIYACSIHVNPSAMLSDLFDLSRFDEPLETPGEKSFTLRELQLLFDGLYKRELSGLISDSEPYAVVL